MQQQLDLLLNSSVDGIFSCDLDFKITEWNKQMERFSGLSKNDCVNKCLFDLFPALKDSSYFSKLKKVIKGKFMIIKGLPFNTFIQSMIIDFYEGYYTPILDDNQNIIGILGIVREVGLRSGNSFTEKKPNIHDTVNFKASHIESDNIHFKDVFNMDDIQEIQENVGPIFGQRARGPRPDNFYKYGDGEPYPYLDLYEQTEIYGQVFQEQERASAIVEANRELIDEVTGRLPPKSERPTVMVGGYWNKIWANVIYFEETTPEVVRDGKVRTYSKKQYRELGVVNAFADATYESPFWTNTDAEGLLEVDPDVIFVDNGVADLEFVEEQRTKYNEDPVTSEVSAVKNDRIYPGGTAVQGPIVNMFQTEMAAKQLYPEEFGEWRGLGETPESERLFDRQRVADIVNGDF